MHPEILPIDSPEAFQHAVEEAAKLLTRGQPVVLPTETVYGLAANALSPTAVAQIFKIKGRPPENPVIVHVASTEMAKRYTAHWPREAELLATFFWPGPLTLVLKKSDDIPAIVTANGSTVGLRWPSHPFMQAVIRACGFPLAAPSANLSSEISPTTADHAAHSLGNRVPLIIDAGPTHVGIESTVVDLSVSPPRLLRPGMITTDQLRASIAPFESPLEQPCENSHPTALRSPGLMAKHYSPKAKLVVLRWRDDADLVEQLLRAGFVPEHTYVMAHDRIPAATLFAGVAIVPNDPEAYARGLYAALHDCDQSAPSAIVAEAVPQNPAWEGIADRLKRASA